MQRFFPVYTQETFCQDCYKCVRECPVKAIRVENERAYIISERCVACGRCVRICPSGAKRIRNDIGRVRFLLQSGKRVYASLAPSWVAVYPDLQSGQLVAALKRLGFAGVSETALGAQEVSAALAGELAANGTGLHISSACPAVVDLVRKHIPELAGAITPVASPALTHCRLLRDHFGPDIAVVFIGPCAAKKPKRIKTRTSSTSPSPSRNLTNGSPSKASNRPCSPRVRTTCLSPNRAARAPCIRLKAGWWRRWCITAAPRPSGARPFPASDGSRTP